MGNLEQSPEPTGRFRSDRTGTLQTVGGCAAFAACYALFGFLGLQLAIPPGYATIVWPAAGIAIAGLLAFGKHFWPGIWIGSFTLNAFNGISGEADASSVLMAVASAAGIATGATAQALVANGLVKKRFAGEVDLSEPRSILALLACAALVPAAVAATIGTASLRLAGALPVSGLSANWLTWYSGDALGILLIFPLVFLQSQNVLTAKWGRRPLTRLNSLMVAALSLSLALTLYTWKIAAVRDYEEGYASFEEMALESSHALSAKLNAHFQALDSAAGFYTASTRVTAEDWSHFVEALNISENLPGLNALGFVANVRPGAVPAFLDEARKDGLSNLSIHPAVEGDEHFIVKYIYPTEGNTGAFGLNIAFEEARRTAAIEARNSGEITLSRPIDLVNDNTNQPGFLILRPVFDRNMPRTSVSERRKALKGWIAAPFLADRFLADLTPSQGESLNLEAAHLGETEKEIFRSSTVSATHAPRFEMAQDLHVAGQIWRVRWTSTPSFETALLSREPVLVLVAGLAVTGALGFILFLAARREEEVQEQVSAITRRLQKRDDDRRALLAELQERNEMLLLTEEVANVGHWRVDLVYDTIHWSDQTKRIHGLPVSFSPTLEFGISAYHSDDQDMVAEHVKRASENGEGFEFTARLMRPNGECRHVVSKGFVESNAEGERTAIFGVIADVTKEVAVQEELRNARDDAEAAVRAKSAFLANMSHEIRTPMNGVMGFTELLFETDLNEEQRTYAQIIADSGRSMMMLLNDILDLSKIEAGQLSISEQAVDLRHLSRRAIRMVEPTAQTKGLDLSLRVDPNVPDKIMADPLRLRQVLLNLLQNAAKFTDEGFVSLIVRQTGDSSIEFAVRDTGIGIPEDRLDAIFGEFVQANAGADSLRGGTGLGLSISRRLVELMGGEMRVASAQGVGTTFFFTVPAKPVDSAEEASQVPHGADGEFGKIAGNARVLVAEDHDINQLLMRSLGKQLGISIDIAADGDEAVAMVKNAALADTPYDLVLMDMQMPVMDGVTATAEIRRSGFGPERLPIVALTANAYADDVEACLSSGMQAHLAKPVQKETLASTIAKWTSSKPDPTDEPPLGGDARVSLRAKYEARKNEVLSALNQFDELKASNETTFAELVSKLHKLAGSAGFFGDDQIGEIASAGERDLIDAKGTTARLDAAASILRSMEHVHVTAPLGD